MATATRSSPSGRHPGRRGPDRLPLGRAGRLVNTYRGSSWIVPPVPVEHNAVAGFARTMKAAVSVPVIATGRIVDPADADAMIARGDCDACGMTRALITDPSMPGRARGGPVVHDLHRLQPGLHRPLPRRHPDRLHDQPVDRARGDAAAPHARSPAPGTVVVVGAGPGWRIRGRLRGRPWTPGGGVRARRGGGRSDAAGTGGVRPRRDRARHGAHRRGLAGGLRRCGWAARPASTRCWPSRPTA